MPPPRCLPLPHPHPHPHPPTLPWPPPGLSLLNISLDTLRPERFVAMTRRQGHERVMAAIRAAADMGFDPGAPPGTAPRFLCCREARGVAS
jgi:hypothetical protein